MSLYDPSLTREPNPAYWYDHVSPIPVPTGEDRFSFKKKGDDWQFIDEAYSLTPYPGFEIDARLVRRVQAIDDELVPVWIRLVFLSPTGGTEVFTRLGLGRVFRRPDYINHDEELKDLLLPTHQLPWWVEKPHIMAAIFRDPSDPDVVPGIPVKPFVPFTTNVVTEIAAQYQETLRAAAHAEDAERETEQWKRESADRDRVRIERFEAEADYNWDHDNRHKNWHAELRDMPGREAEEAVAMTRVQ